MKKIYESTSFTAADLALQEALFHTANGYVGVRGTLEEGLPDGVDTMRGTYINGFYDIVPMKQAELLAGLVEDKEALLNIADTQTLRLQFGNESFSMQSGEILRYRRTVDMDAGVTRREVRWRSPGGKEVDIRFVRMASHAQPSLFTIDVEITPLNFWGIVTVHSLHTGLVRNYANPDDPRMAADSDCYLVPLPESQPCDADGHSYLCTGTKTSGLSLCVGVAHTFEKTVRWSAAYNETRHETAWEFVLPLKKGVTTRLVKYCVFTDSMRHTPLLVTCKTLLSDSVGKIDHLYKQQADYLRGFWNNAVLDIEGDDESRISVYFNQYQLLQSTGRDGLCSLAAKGLSGEGYEGHYFWDTEMYVLPFFTLTNPEIARQLLVYRHSTLEQARDNAKRLGHRRGVLFPWRTITGRECSGYYPSGDAAYHINGAIAYAVVQYFLTTGDEDFLAGYGAELLVETARLWMDTGHWYQGAFHINCVTGPDEYTCMVNDNYYTNACARHNLVWAVKCAERIKNGATGQTLLQSLGVTEEELEEMRHAAKGMLLAYDEEQGIHPQDTAFLQKPIWDLAATPKDRFPLLLHYHPLHIYRHQVCKQADTVLAYYLFDDLADRETMLKSFHYYEGITTHDSSLSQCIFSIVASQLGERDKARAYFGDSAKLDLYNTHGNTWQGVHTANMGGCYMAVVNGFAGLRVREDGLYLNPFLPHGWQGYRFRFRYKTSRLELSVNRSGCRIILLSGPPITACVAGTWREIHTLKEER